MDAPGQGREKHGGFDGVEALERAAPWHVRVVGPDDVFDLVERAFEDVERAAVLRVTGDEDAANGGGAGAVVVDLRSAEPGLIGRLGRARPDLAILGVTEAGDTRGAVEAMRQGAADVLEWPLGREALRSSVARCLTWTGDARAEYDERVAVARRQILRRAFAVARAQLRRAASVDLRRPEAFNLLGVIEQVQGRRLAAQRWWRMALLLDGAYRPARDNLERSTRRPAPQGGLALG